MDKISGDFRLRWALDIAQALDYSGQLKAQGWCNQIYRKVTDSYQPVKY